MVCASHSHSHSPITLPALLPSTVPTYVLCSSSLVLGSFRLYSTLVSTLLRCRELERLIRFQVQASSFLLLSQLEMRDDSSRYYVRTIVGAYRSLNLSVEFQNCRLTPRHFFITVLVR